MYRIIPERLFQFKYITAKRYAKDPLRAFGEDGGVFIGPGGKENQVDFYYAK